MVLLKQRLRKKTNNDGDDDDVRVKKNQFKKENF